MLPRGCRLPRRRTGRSSSPRRAAGAGAGGLAAALGVVRAQQVPYQPAQVSTVRLADGQAGLRIDFAAPSPLGLLTGSASR